VREDYALDLFGADLLATAVDQVFDPTLNEV